MYVIRNKLKTIQHMIDELHTRYTKGIRNRNEGFPYINIDKPLVLAIITKRRTTQIEHAEGKSKVLLTDIGI